MKRFVFWIWALCAAAPGFADQVTIDGVTWTYSVRSREGASYAVIEEASGVRGAVTVPATLGGAPVRRRGARSRRSGGMLSGGAQA